MSTSTLRSLASGAFFGAALTAAGVYSPAVIVGQLKLENFHMLKTFLAASASSAVAIIIAQKLNITNCKPRTPNSLGWFGAYDGNIIGGVLLGVGLALTGACPGTVLPQVVTGVPSGAPSLVGGLLGGIVYSKFGKQLQASIPSASPAMQKPTVYQSLNTSKATSILAYEAFILGFIAMANRFFPDNEQLLIPAAVGGILIGVSQAMSLILTGGTIGISTAYEQLGDVFWWAEESIIAPFSSSTSSPDQKTSHGFPNIKGNAFAVGTMLGAFVVSKSVQIPDFPEVEISALRAIAGGAIMIYGSRIAGGCTGGHGISGMSQLSIASIISVAAMFGGGIAVSLFL